MRPISVALTASLLFSLAASVTLAATDPLWSDGALDTGIGPNSPVTFNAFSKLAAEAAPAVVSIETETARRVRGPLMPFFAPGDMPFAHGAGSGFIIHPDGYLLSNHHVVGDADTIQVHLLDGRSFEAKLLGSDAATDIALLKIDPKGKKLPTVPLGDSGVLGIGEWVVAIGNPMGLSHTVTAGIVSAKGRKEVRPGRELRYANFIQTDASINPGNSGGPLFNLRGQVIGINTAINARAQGIGFAIPVNMVKTIVHQLADGGVVERSWIGVGIQPVTDHLARSFGLTAPKGALVSSVVRGGPAADAGLEPGDVIVAFGDAPIRAHDDLPWLASTAGVGRTIPLTVLREGKQRTIPLTLGRLPGQDPTPARVTRGGPEAAKRHTALGMVLVPLDRASARRADVDHGVVIGGVDAGSPASGAGLRPGDIVRRCNGRAVESAAQFARQLENVKPQQIIRLLVQRGANSLFIAFER